MPIFLYSISTSRKNQADSELIVRCLIGPVGIGHAIAAKNERHVARSHVNFVNLKEWIPMLKIKSILTVMALVGLFVSNFMTLTSSVMHDYFHSALWRVLAIGGEVFADRALRQSTISIAEEKIKARTQALQQENLNLKDQNLKLAKKIDAHSQATKSTVSKVHGRLKAGIKRNITALPSEAVPYLGVGVAIGVAALDVYDACQTMRDVNNLLRLMGQGQESEDLCGVKVPTKDQVIASIKMDWRNSWQAVAEDVKKAGQTMSEIRMPTLPDIGKLTCPVAPIVMLCSEN